MIGAVLDDCSVGTRCRNLGQWYKAVSTALTGAILKGLEARPLVVIDDLFAGAKHDQ